MVIHWNGLTTISYRIILGQFRGYMMGIRLIIT